MSLNLAAHHAGEEATGVSTALGKRAFDKALAFPGLHFLGTGWCICLKWFWRTALIALQTEPSANTSHR
jgi:hypothetical protein